MNDASAAERALAAAARFRLAGEPLALVRLAGGNINDSWAVTAGRPGAATRYVLQELNTAIFSRPEALMDNLVRVTDHLRAKLSAQGIADLSRRVLTPVAARDGRFWHRGPDGGFWRCCLFIEGVRAVELVSGPGQARALGRELGRFHALLADLPGPGLAETIPAFHDARRHAAAFEAALAEDALGRAAPLGAEIAFFRAERRGMERLVRALESGELPSRVTHNDARIGNLLLDSATGEPVCFIDLDTVMPGTVAYDFGDLARSASATTGEDDPDPARMGFSLPRYAALARGYAEGAVDPRTGRSFLTAAERELLPASGRVFACALGMRFLTDHLRGDAYFRTARPGQNLDRARAQIALARAMDRERDAIAEATVAAFDEAGRLARGDAPPGSERTEP